MRIWASPHALLASFFCQRASGCVTADTGESEGKFVIKPVAEKRLSQLPEAPLYWRIETFPAGSSRGCCGTNCSGSPVTGKVWLFTLGAPGGSTSGGAKVAEISPVPQPPEAPAYLLRINNASGPRGPYTRTRGLRLSTCWPES